MDLIRRADAMKIVNSAFRGEIPYAIVGGLIKALPSAEPENIFCSPDAEWIPCSERLPESDGRYIVAIMSFAGQTRTDIMYYGKPLMPNCKVKGKCWYRDDDEWGDVVYDDEDILAWMPLPEPYREDGEA